MTNRPGLSAGSIPNGFAYYFILIHNGQFFQTLSFFFHFVKLSGDEGIRTPDLRLAKAALSQLSYIPELPG